MPSATYKVFEQAMRAEKQICCVLDRVTLAALHDGPWRMDDGHSQPQGCVDEVDLDVNPASPYNPKRRM